MRGFKNWKKAIKRYKDFDRATFNPINISWDIFTIITKVEIGGKQPPIAKIIYQGTEVAMYLTL